MNKKGNDQKIKNSKKKRGGNTDSSQDTKETPKRERDNLTEIQQPKKIENKR